MGLTNGQYSLSVMAPDEAGNVSQPATAAFTVKQQSGSIPGFQPKPGPDPTPGPGPDPTPEDQVGSQGGCSVGSSGAEGSTPGAGWLLIVLLGIAALRRRDRSTR